MQTTLEPAARSGGTKCGYVLLAGLPNAGKSTLLNALVGERLSIVTPKAQTTWRAVAGIRSEPGVQMVFWDTPGVTGRRSLFDRSMAAETERALRDADVAVVVADGTATGTGRRQSQVASEVAASSGVPTVVAVNKLDVARFDDGAAARLRERTGLPAHCISAAAGEGLDKLLAFVRDHVPRGPFLFPADEVAVAPVRFFVQELVREAVFEQYRDEVPYAVAVRVEEFRDGEPPVYVAVSLNVERRSQKPILVGRQGAAVKRLGMRARPRIERFLGRRVYLDLRVKVWAGWRRKKEGLMEFGHAAPQGGR